jgi:hypothetical protein
MKILLIGVGRFVRILGGKLQERGVEASFVDVAEWKYYSLVRRVHMLKAHDLAHFYWGRHIKIAEVLTCRCSGTRIVYTFVGSDVLRLQSLPRWKQARARLGLREADCITAVSPWLCAELRDLGIAACAVPFAIVQKPTRVAPLPKRFTLLSYVPVGKERFYGWETIEKLARDLPDADFSIVGHDGTGLPKLTNVRYHGWVDAVGPFIERASALVRPTYHDGLARTVLEALSHSRHVFWTYDYPHCHTIRDYESLLADIRTLREHPSLNEAGGHYAWERFSQERIMSDCLALYTRVMAGESGALAAERAVRDETNA